jgi:hypothetical protein
MFGHGQGYQTTKMKLLPSFSRTMPKWLSRLVLLLAVSLLLWFCIRWVLPIYRVQQRSELIMLGDFNNDKKWDEKDREMLQGSLAQPFSKTPIECLRADLNNSGTLDPEDLTILQQLCADPDPYAAEAKAIGNGFSFPRPRELYRYVSFQEYINRPLFALPYKEAEQSPLDCLKAPRTTAGASPYARQLSAEIHDEAVRLDCAYRARLPKLTPVELDYSRQKLMTCNQLYKAGRDYDLLLELIGLVEDAETVTTVGQEAFISKTLFLRDDLRSLLASPQYAAFQKSTVPAQPILKEIEKLLKDDLNLEVDLEHLGKPRDLTSMDNYVSRTQWQYYKTRTKTEAFERLIRFAQHDRRYLRAVARTSRKHSDPGVENHNLPMVLLFREAVRITGDKKAAVGLLDESIRIPLFWVKSIPRDKLPSSLALENFLLPGNKEDGADKSRHWNVFGGICLYKSAEESLDLALKREIQDLREGQFSAEAMTEFIRDTIANLNGIYYVVSMNPELLYSAKAP